MSLEREFLDERDRKLLIDTLKSYLIEEAINQYENIYPCKNQSDFTKSFTVDESKLIFWFNTEDNNTHMVSCKLGKYTQHINL